MPIGAAPPGAARPRQKGRRPAARRLPARLRCSTADGVALLPGNARPDDPSGWLPLAEVFQALRDGPADRRLSLLLDLARPLTDLRAGVVANDVAERLEPVIDKAVADDKGLNVLTACARGRCR